MICFLCGAKNFSSSSLVAHLNTAHSNEFKSDVEQPELLELLTEWGVPVLYDRCLEEGIDLDALSKMTARHAELLTKNFKLAVLVQFEHNLKKWQMGDHQSATPGNFSERSIVEEGPSSFEITAINTNLDAFEAQKVLRLDKILEQSREGRTMLERSKNNQDLNDGCRAVLIETITNYLFQNNIKMTTNIADELSKQIAVVFPRENQSVYFYREKGRPPKGKLYAKYYNQVRYLKSSGLFTTTTCYSRSPQHDTHVLEPEENITEHLEAIESDICSWAEMQSHYVATTNYRLINISQSSSIAEIFQTWKQYKSMLGFKLIDSDYKTLHPDSGSLFDNFSEYEERFLQIVEGKMRDQNSLGLLRDMREAEFLSENGRCAAIMYLLHAVLVPTSKSIRTENGKRIHIKYSIKDSQNSFLIVVNTPEEIESTLKGRGEMQSATHPIVAITGSIIDPKMIYVYFAGTEYTFQTILEAVDTCFKIFVVFNLEFPYPAIQFWCFIQKFFYGVKTKHDRQFGNVDLLYSQLKPN